MPRATDTAPGAASVTTPGQVTRDVLQTLDEVQTQVFARLDGLTDDEYLREPVPACLPVRADADGEFRADPRPRGAELGVLRDLYHHTHA